MNILVGVCRQKLAIRSEHCVVRIEHIAQNVVFAEDLRTFCVIFECIEDFLRLVAITVLANSSSYMFVSLLAVIIHFKGVDGFSLEHSLVFGVEVPTV